MKGRSWRIKSNASLSFSETMLRHILYSISSGIWSPGCPWQTPLINRTYLVFLPSLTDFSTLSQKTEHLISLPWDWIQILVPRSPFGMIRGKTLGNNVSIYHIKLLKGFTELIQVKWLEECLGCILWFINVIYVLLSRIICLLWPTSP